MRFLVMLSGGLDPGSTLNASGVEQGIAATVQELSNRQKHRAGSLFDITMEDFYQTLGSL
jgi:hypothetical protein